MASCKSIRREHTLYNSRVIPLQAVQVGVAIAPTRRTFPSSRWVNVLNSAALKLLCRRKGCSEFNWFVFETSRSTLKILSRFVRHFLKLSFTHRQQNELTRRALGERVGSKTAEQSESSRGGNTHWVSEVNRSMSRGHATFQQQKRPTLITR